MPSVLIVITSHDKLGNTDKKTGFWLEELAAPYWAFKDAKYEVTLASPKGGKPPLDPASDNPEKHTESEKRFVESKEAQAQLATTVVLSTVKESDYDVLFYPGGHGPLWDLAEDRSSIHLIEKFAATGKPLGFVCHAPAALKEVKRPDGEPLVHSRRVAAFSDSEEKAVGLSDVVPFSLHTMLTERGAHVHVGPDWAPFVVTDGNLVTGQNPGSSAEVAAALIKLQTEGTK